MDPERIQAWTHLFAYSQRQEQLLQRMMQWSEGAACRKHAAFLVNPVNEKLGRTEMLKLWRIRQRVCEGCPVQAECLHHALWFPEIYDVWGGLTPKQREAMRKNLMLKISDLEVSSTYTEYAVDLSGGIVECEDEHEARYLARLYDDAPVLCRRVYETAWAELDGNLR